jgi:glycosyltransferase involved in cell wall biosynthesis
MGKGLLELLREGLRQTDWTFVLFGDEPRSPMHAVQDGRVISHIREIKGHRLHVWEQLGLPWMVKQFGCDLLHCASTWAPAVQTVPTVVTLHDTLPWTEERPDAYARLIAPAAYRRARRIVTPSENSRRDIVTRWPALAPRTTVIQWGIDAAYLSHGATNTERLARYGIREPYILYFGGEIPRKRLSWALRVWAALGDRSDLQLVLCGLQSPTEHPWKREVSEHLRDRIVPLGFVPEADMPAVYANAEAVLYPTLYEGFGFPAVESQAAGTPVLMSPVGSLTELAGPGAVLLPAEDFDAWVAALRLAPATKRRTGESAREWARVFSWSRVWQQFQAVFEEATSTGHR